MFTVANSLYKDLCSRTHSLQEKFEKIHRREEVLTALGKKVAEDMGINLQNISVLPRTDSFQSLSPFFSGSPLGSQLAIPPIYLIDLKEIPSKYLIRSEHDSRLQDRTFLRELQNFMIEYFKKKGYDFPLGGKLQREVLGCEILSVVHALQNKPLAQKRLEFSLRYQVALAANNTLIKESALHLTSFAFSLLVAIAVGLLLPTGAILSLLTAFATLTVVNFLLDVNVLNPTCRDMKLSALRQAVTGRADIIDAAFSTFKEKDKLRRYMVTLPEKNTRKLLEDALEKCQAGSPLSRHPSKGDVLQVLHEERAKLKEEKAI